MKLVCIPAYNAEKAIGNVVKKCLKYVDQVIVCDDGSIDNTAKVAKDSGARVLTHQKNQGYGAALITMFEQARKDDVDIMITLDGDGQHDPQEIPLFLKSLEENNVDVVIGSRFLNKDSKAPGYRQKGIKIITATVKLGNKLKITDAQSGFRAYSKKAINKIHPTETGMSASTEILQKISNNDLTVTEVPITVLYEGDTSKHNPLSHGTSVLANTLKYISVKHPMLFYGLPGVAALIAGIIIGYNFLENYLINRAIFLGSLFGSLVLILIGVVLIATSVILFSMSVLWKDQK
ncbi:MAG: glycosyltransferase family 2 protein [Nitrosarchaeum sp.]